MVPGPQDSSVQVGDRGRQNHSDQGLCVLGWKYNVLWEEMEKRGNSYQNGDEGGIPGRETSLSLVVRSYGVWFT